jgi:hypothetical protein
MISARMVLPPTEYSGAMRAELGDLWRRAETAAQPPQQRS